METNELMQLGALGILFALAIKEFFAYLKTRKNGHSETVDNVIVAALNKLGDNHLNHVEMAVKEGDQKIVEKLNELQIKTLEVLIEIKERLPK